MEVVKINWRAMHALGDPSGHSAIFSIFDVTSHAGVRMISDQWNDLRRRRAARYLDFIYYTIVEKFNDDFRKIHFKGRYVERLNLSFLFQADDGAVNVNSAGWQSQSEWKKIRLVPDIYYFDYRGYETFFPLGDPSLPRWEDRLPKLVWRGTSTGVPLYPREKNFSGISTETLERLPRYRLCQAAQRLGEGADVGFVGLAQALPEHQDALQARLKREGLMRPFMPVSDMAGFKFLVEIDGNASSWNCIQRLRLGCCVLKVESDWTQWFSADLTPWRHFVPVKADLSDLAEQVEWCLTHDQEASEIAANGREFALAMSFETEMKKAALRILEVCEPVEPTGAAFEAFRAAVASASPAGLAMKQWRSGVHELDLNEDVVLVTHHGTVLGQDSKGGLAQLETAAGSHSMLVLSPRGGKTPKALEEFQVIRSADTLSLLRDGHFLSALPDHRTITRDRGVAQEWETFRIVPKASLAPRDRAAGMKRSTARGQLPGDRPDNIVAGLSNGASSEETPVDLKTSRAHQRSHSKVGQPVKLGSRACLQTAAGERGFVVFGPYEPYAPGRYLATFTLALPKGYVPYGDNICCEIDVVGGGASATFASAPIYVSYLSATPRQFHLAFQLDRPADLEFRVRALGHGPLIVDEERVVTPVDNATGRYSPVLPPDEVSPPELFVANAGAFRGFFDRGIQFEIDHNGIVATCRGVRLAIENVEDFVLLNEVFINREYGVVGGGGLCAIDIGMNVGFTSLYLASQPFVQEVHGFEPFVEPFDRAHANVALNPGIGAKVSLNNFGLSDFDGEQVVGFKPGYTIGASIRGREGGEKITIQIRDAAAVLGPVIESAAARGLKVFAKIDCEGSEFSIFESLRAAGLLARITAVAVEWHKSWDYGKKQDVLLAPLLAEGFVVFDVTRAPNQETGFFYAVRAAADEPRRASTQIAAKREAAATH